MHQINITIISTISFRDGSTMTIQGSGNGIVSMTSRTKKWYGILTKVQIVQATTNFSDKGVYGLIEYLTKWVRGLNFDSASQAVAEWEYELADAKYDYKTHSRTYLS